MTESDRKRLGDAVSDRRGQLRMTQDEFARAAGITTKQLQRIEAGLVSPRAGTLAGLDEAAVWEPGSSRRTLAGGRPKLRAVPIRIPPLSELERMPATDVLKVRERVREMEGDEAADAFWREFLAHLDRRSSRDPEHQP